jgi:hydroxymethylbilane synthase
MIVPIEDGAQAGKEMAAKLLEQAGEGFFDWRES